jgi:DNA-directed RNA polymerase specialized sigma24 family protein
MSWTERDIELLISGDRATNHRFVREIGLCLERVVRRLIARYGVPQHEAGDLLQDLFTDLIEHDWRAVRAWRPDGGRTLPGFLGVFARLRTIDRLRQRGHTIPVDDVELYTVAERYVQATSLPVELGICLERIVERLRRTCTADEWRFFERGIVEEAPAEELVREFEVSRDAVFARRTRMREWLRQLRVEVCGDATAHHRSAS